METIKPLDKVADAIRNLENNLSRLIDLGAITEEDKDKILNLVNKEN